MSGTLNLVDGIEEMMKSKFAFLTLEPNLYRLAQEMFRKDEICKLVSVPPHNDFGVAMFMKDKSDLKELFQRGYVFILTLIQLLISTLVIK